MYRILKLKDTQAGVLTLVFKISDAGVFAGWGFEAIGLRQDSCGIAHSSHTSARVRRLGDGS